MLFNSNEFLFIFLPLVLVAFHGLRAAGVRELAFVVLLAASIIFYAYWSVIYCALFVASVVCNYGLAMAIMHTRSRLLTTLGIIANLLLLGYFKYTNFLIDVINQASGSAIAGLDIVLPIGISFYTFIQIAFLVDVYTGKAREPRAGRYGLFVSFFPHMLAGPIVHHKEMMPQFGHAMPRPALQRMMAVGACLLVIGLVKKVLIADRIALLASPAFNQAATGQAVDFFTAWLGVLAYTFQIYFDFSGYSDMAIGLALMFGIRFPSNFNSPYRSRNIIEFWRRWHMTLSRLLRDYIYIPLGGNRKGDFRRHANLMATMLIGGAWHGAGWTFIFWGGLHGLYLAINHIWIHNVGIKLGRFGGVLTFFAVIIAWVPFRAVDMPTTMSIYGAMIGANGLSAPLELATFLRMVGVSLTDLGIEIIADNQRAEYYTNIAILILAMVLAFLAPNSIQILRRYSPVLDSRRVLADGPPHSRISWRPGLASGALAGLFLFFVIRSINSAAPSEFLYFQF